MVLLIAKDKWLKPKSKSAVQSKLKTKEKQQQKPSSYSICLSINIVHMYLSLTMLLMFIFSQLQLLWVMLCIQPNMRYNFFSLKTVDYTSKGAISWIKLISKICGCKLFFRLAPNLLWYHLYVKASVLLCKVFHRIT